MRAHYIAKQSHNHVAVVKSDRIEFLPNGQKTWVDGKTVKFENWHLVTEDEEVIKFMDDPKNGNGWLWEKIEGAKPAPERPSPQTGKVIKT